MQPRLASSPTAGLETNILIHTEIAAHLEATGESGCLLFLDFSKAFDYVEGAWILRVMREMGFGNAGCRWAQLFLSGTQGARTRQRRHLCLLRR